jgi:DHA2 family methylenomycin A resistance protein-like MFS transporter
MVQFWLKHSFRATGIMTTMNSTGNRMVPTRFSSAHRALAAACIAFALIQLDVTIVNVALARIGAALAVPVAGLQWIVDAYTLVFAGLMLPAGSVADRRGPPRALIAGLCLFAGASAACAAAGSLAVLITARVAQGIGAALLMPASLALVRSTFSESAARARAIGIWGAAGMTAMVAGPLFGGALIAALGWRSIFWVNLPPAGIAAMLILPCGPIPDSRAAAPNLASAGFATAAITALTAAVIAGPHGGWTGWCTLLLAAVAVIASAAFRGSEWRADRHHGQYADRVRPLIPRALRSSAHFRRILATGFAVSFCIYGLLFALSLYWQQLRGWSPFATGLAFLPLTVLGLVASIVAGRWIARCGSHAPALSGFGLTACGFAGLCFIGATTGFLWLVPSLLAIGTGSVLAVMGLTTALLEHAPGAVAGVASGAFSAARQAGAAVGVAVFGALVATPGQFIDGFHRAAAAGAITALGSAITVHKLFACTPATGIRPTAPRR